MLTMHQNFYDSGNFINIREFYQEHSLKTMHVNVPKTFHLLRLNSPQL